MQNSYPFLLTNPGLRQYNRIAYIISLLNLLFFAWLAFIAPVANNSATVKVFVLLIAFSFAFEWLYKKFISNRPYYFIVNYILLAAGWIFVSANYGMFLLHVLLGAMDVIVRQNIYLTINEDGITQSQWKLKKKYDWNEFDNIILKDALLTLDFKNNKIRYCNISEPVNEVEFNEFCRQKLSS